MPQLITEGPQIPEDVYQALGNDNLVFFCGAGISTNNKLPPFNELVRKVCAKLNIDINKEPLLREAKKRENYDGILDLIEGNQSFSVSRQTLRKEIIEILNKPTGEPDIHKSLLELSALSKGRGHRLVTTNFDRLFFKAGLKSQFDSAPKLAPPRKETWKNLTFLHGVIDRDRYPEGDNLILTRRDFGLAYLYDNWSSRFIIQLFQDFTVLFIGYSVADPVMNYLVSAISYENQRRRQNNSKTVHSKDFNGNQENEDETKPTIYAFAGYKKGEREEKQNRWKSLGVEPILYKITKDDDHSLLYDTIREWASRKKTGLTGSKNWLKEKLKSPYKESDKEIAESVISFLKTDERLAKYLPEINLSKDSKQRLPVDISWLKVFSGEGKESKTRNKNNRRPFFFNPESKPENSLLKKLTNRTAQSKSSPYSLWEPLSSIEKSIASWLLHHLDKKKLIHWLIKQASAQTGLISLHPEFKDMLKWQLKNIQENTNQQLDERKALFWEIVTMQEGQKLSDAGFLIGELNIGKYSYGRVKKLLSCLEPQIGFETYFYHKEFSNADKIYDPKLTIGMNRYPYKSLTDKTTLLLHAEDFSNLLKKAMELAELSEIIQNEEDHFCIVKPSIAPHSQNKNYHSWTYLIDLVRDSFDCAMEKDKKLAELLLNKWQLYSYPLFYRLILYVVTKYLDLKENLVIDLFRNTNVLWSRTCQNEVLKYLKTRKHSKMASDQLVSLIMQGPPKSLFNHDVEDNIFKELKERSICLRLHRLKISGVPFPEDIESYYNEIPKKYSFKLSMEKDNDQEDFPFYHTGPKRIGSEKRYHHNQTDSQIFEDIKHTEPGTYPTVTDKRENFRPFIKDFPERAFKILSMFKDNDINSASFWDDFIYEISVIKDIQKSNEYFEKSIKKIEKFSDDFLKKCLLSLIHGFDLKGGLIYYKDEKQFQKWWNRLWKLSMENQSDDTDSDPSFQALNSPLGKLSQSIFKMLWSKFSNKIPRNGKIPEDVKNYLQTVIQDGIKKDPSVFCHLGSYLWSLWFLDKEWSNTNIKPLLNWNNETICKAFWAGYLHHPKWSPDFLSDLKNEFFQLLLNRKVFYQDRDSIYYCENIADTLFIATGGREIKNIFTKEETQKIAQNMDAKILETLSIDIWILLKDSKDKSVNLWSDKIKPWMEVFWPPQNNLKTQKIAQELSLVMLYCSDKLPEAFEFLKDKIKDIIKQNHGDILSHIENHEQELNHIFNYPEKLLSLLNWNFPDNITFCWNEKLKKLLDKLKNRRPEIDQNADYLKLLDKIS